MSVGAAPVIVIFDAATVPVRANVPPFSKVSSFAPLMSPSVTVPVPASIVVSAARVVLPRVIAAFVVEIVSDKTVGPSMWVKPAVKAHVVEGFVASLRVSVPVVANVVAGVKEQPALKAMSPASAASVNAVVTVTLPPKAALALWVIVRFAVFNAWSTVKAPLVLLTVTFE